MGARLNPRTIVLGVVAAACALGLSYYATKFAIDFGVYYSIAHNVFYRGTSAYGIAADGMDWPMYYRYPPPFLFMVAPWLHLPFEAAAFLWTLLKSGVLAWFVYALHRRFGGLSGAANGLIALCVAGPYVAMEFRYGNVQFLVFVLAAYALLYSRDRPYLSAFSLGLAITIKVWPLFFAPYLVARREWRIPAMAVAVVLVLLLLPSAYFGWQGNLALLEEWYEQETGIVDNVAQIWFPSQSLHGVLTRYLTELDYRGFPDPGYPNIHLASLAPESVDVLWALVVFAGYGLLLWLATNSRYRFRPEVDGLAFCTLVLLQPYSQKHSALVVLVWPALVAVSGPIRRFPLWGRICLISAAALGVAQVFLPTPAWHRLFQVMGTDALLTTLLAATLLSLLLAGRRDRKSSTGETAPLQAETGEGALETAASGTR